MPFGECFHPRLLWARTFLVCWPQLELDPTVILAAWLWFCMHRAPSRCINTLHSKGPWIEQNLLIKMRTTPPKTSLVFATHLSEHRQLWIIEFKTSISTNCVWKYCLLLILLNKQISYQLNHWWFKCYTLISWSFPQAQMSSRLSLSGYCVCVSVCVCVCVCVISLYR